MKLADFLLYLYYAECKELDRKRRYYLWRGPTGGLAQVPRNNEYLERGTIYIACMDLGIDMPEKFAGFQRTMDLAWPGRKFGS